MKARKNMRAQQLLSSRQKEQQEEARRALEEKLANEKKKRGVTNSLLAVSQKIRAEEEAAKDAPTSPSSVPSRPQA